MYAPYDIHIFMCFVFWLCYQLYVIDSPIFTMVDSLHSDVTQRDMGRMDQNATKQDKLQPICIVFGN